MTDQRVDADNVTEGGGRQLRCLGRLVWAALIALTGLLLANTNISPSIATALAAGLWLWLALSVTVSVVQTVKAVRKAAAQPGITNPLYFMRQFSPVCASASLMLLAVAAGALFAAGERSLAMAFELFLFAGLALILAPESEFGPEKRENTFEDDYTPIASGPGAIRLAVAAGAVWLALGSPPGWAESLILTWFWFGALALITFQCIAVFSLSALPWMVKHHLGTFRRNNAASETQPWPAVTPEPSRTPLQRFNMRLWRASSIAVTWALWTAGQPALVGLYVLGILLTMATRTHVRRKKHGETARIDILARTVHFVFWWPLAVTATIVGTLAAVMIFIPVGAVGAVYRVVAGKTPAQPPAESERDARIRKARIRRAAASYRLREAFCRPEGFVYFMCSESHQQKHFLGPDGALAGLGDRVVARDYRRDVLETRNIFNWMAFEQAPEGALLHVNGVSNMRRDLPFVAIVPPHGPVQSFSLSEAYRARTRDKGAALKEAEQEVRAAIAAAGL